VGVWKVAVFEDITGRDTRIPPRTVRTLQAAIFLLAACGTKAPPPDPADPCARYAQMADAHALCLRQQVATNRDPAAMAQTCARAGKGETACRAAWVWAFTPEEQGFSREVLLDACGDDDCRMSVLDGRVEDDVVLQLGLCDRNAGVFEKDCAIHALARWWYTRPDPTEAGRLASSGAPFQDDQAQWLAALVVCRNLGACASWPLLAERCEAAVTELRADPHRCPANRPRAGSASQQVGR
jgi:hypothetical protein